MTFSSHQEIQILHVDDNPSITDLAGTFLERDDERFTVETATSADEGLERINDCTPDCVVSDYNMPGTDGIEFLQAVREEYPDLPFILFTGKGSETVASDAIAAGVTDYLQKETGTEQYQLLANRIKNAVHARREAERADRQEQLMRLTEFAGDTGGFEVNTETGDMLLTDGARRILNVPEDATLSAEDTLEMTKPALREEIRQTMDQTVETGEQTHGVWPITLPNGEQRILDVTYTPTAPDEDDATLRGAICDITEQKERERELRSERQFIEQALNTLDDLFYVLNMDGTLRRWNDRVPELTGYADNDLAEMDATELFLEDDRETIADAIQMAVSGETVTVEADLLTADGERVPYEFTGAQLTDEDGTVTGLVGVGRGLTERRQRERQLERQNDLFARAQDIADVGAWAHNTESQTLTWTDRVYEMHGVSKEFDPSLEEVVQLYHPDDRPKLRKAVDQAVTAGKPYDLEVRMTAKDDGIRWIRTVADPQTENGEVVRVRGAVHDITDQKQREQ